MTTRLSYPSDISRDQFEVIRPTLESFRRRTKPKVLDLYDIYCGILYVTKTGCQWSALPHDYPAHHTVYTCFRQWAAKPYPDQPSLLERLLEAQVEAVRVADDREKNTTFLIMDAQSVGNTDLPEETGYDAGKKVSGIKRHIAVDTNGLPHAIALTTADVTDRKGGLLALSCRAACLSTVKKVPVDGSYTGQPFAESVAEIIPGAEVEVVKRNELKTFVVLPQRWVVERSFGWLDKYRRLWKNAERLLNNSLQLVNMAFLSMLLKRL